VRRAAIASPGSAVASPKIVDQCRPAYDRVIVVNGETRDSVIRAAIADLVNSVTVLRQNGQASVADALKQLAERISGCEILPEIRQDILENLAFVGQQALLRPDRRKRGVVKAVLAYVRHTMQTVEPLMELWHTFGRTVENFFNL